MISGHAWSAHIVAHRPALLKRRDNILILILLYHIEHLLTLQVLVEISNRCEGKIIIIFKALQNLRWLNRLRRNDRSHLDSLRRLAFTPLSHLWLRVILSVKSLIDLHFPDRFIHLFQCWAHFFGLSNSLLGVLYAKCRI